MEQKIYEILKERFGIEDTINSDTDLVNQLGFESISLVELASVLSKETGVKVTHSQAIKWTTVMHMHALCLIQLQMKYHIVMVLMEPVVQWQQDVQQELIL